jgi:hypothetical protein
MKLAFTYPQTRIGQQREEKLNITTRPVSNDILNNVNTGFAGLIKRRRISMKLEMKLLSHNICEAADPKLCHKKTGKLYFK